MCNVGGIDRIVLIVAGVFLLSLVFAGDQIIGKMLFGAGLVLCL